MRLLSPGRAPLAGELARLEVAPDLRTDFLAREARATAVFTGLAAEDARALVVAARAESMLVCERGGEALVSGPALLLQEVAKDLPPALGAALRHALAAARGRSLRHARGVLDLARPAVMGIVNVTPDSFSDGGIAFESAAAIAQGERLAAEGAAIVDVGGESTRPGAATVDAAEELRRVLPVVEGLAARGIVVSIDTRKAAIARRALEAGAAIVNDVSALADPDMAPLLAERRAGAILMHMRGTPEDMQRDPRYRDLVGEIAAFLAGAARRAEAAGAAPDAIALDPGIGFGKTVEHNLELLLRLEELATLGYPVAVGISRKSMLGRITGRGPGERLAAGVAAAALAVARGARLIRAHDVRETVDAVAVASAISGPTEVDNRSHDG